MSDPLPLPKDPKHQRFADYYLAGMPAPDAYRKAKLKVGTDGSVRTMASRLLKKVDVAAYIAAVRQEAGKGSVLTLQEIREFNARIVRTPLRAIDPNDPGFKDGDLIVKYRYKASGEDVVEEIVKHCPLKAIAIDLKLSGDDPEANALQQMADALAKIGAAQGTLPSDKM